MPSNREVRRTEAWNKRIVWGLLFGVIAVGIAFLSSGWWRGKADGTRSKQSLAEQCRIQLKEAEKLHYRNGQLAAAEQAYRVVLGSEPDNIAANTGLAKLLTLCGRKRESVPNILRLIRQDVETDLLILLAKQDAGINDMDLLQAASQASPHDPNPRIGLAWHLIQKDQFREAERLLREAIRSDPDNIPARILVGQILMAENRDSEFAGWDESLPTAAGSVAEVWLLRGQMSEVIGEKPSAIRCYWECLRMAAESKLATYRLAHLLAEIGDEATARLFHKRLETLILLEETQNRTLFSSGQGRMELLWPLARAYESAGRFWEAYGWCRFATNLGIASNDATDMTVRLQRILKNEPLKLVGDAANLALRVDLSRFPVKDLRLKNYELNHQGSISSKSVIHFEDESVLTGLKFRFLNGVASSTQHRMFEMTGGGIGVIDFDLDSYADLYFTQGGIWPTGSAESKATDRIYRNWGAESFRDVSQFTGVSDCDFGQGLSIGDYDSDGFPDVYVANIGRNRLWQNQGDGTFRDVTQWADVDPKKWTTSTVIADLTGDGLPDIYDVNYLSGDDVFERVCPHPGGSSRQCLPSDFGAQPDRLWENLGDGRFRDSTNDVLGEVPLGKGLGIVAWDSDNSGRLSVFVANDTTPCFLFRPSLADRNSRLLRESGVEAGVAFNGDGKATGSMGIAIGDVDGDGTMDLFITNFYAEPNTLFLNQSAGFFEDRTRQANLEAPSLYLLGFGTQFLDADLDGQVELFVSNGHVDDLSPFGRPYRMPPQLFRQDKKGHFAELHRQEIGAYFGQDWLGRAVARVDWNRDGREDLVIGHLLDEYALLTNKTTDSGHAVVLKLVGIQSNRDAIGTSVKATIGGRILTRQLTAGDGYQASNERKLIIGTGSANVINKLQVTWPSGQVQSFSEIKAPGEFVLREGDSLLELLTSNPIGK